MLLFFSISTAIRKGILERNIAPGPGAYNSANLSAGPKFKFNQQGICSNLRGSSIPGPGTYYPDHKIIEKTISSKITFGVRKLEEFTQLTPGPGTYNTDDDCIKKGSSSVKIPISSRNYCFDLKEDVPGPGSYIRNIKHSLLGGVFTRGKRYGKLNNTEVPGPGSYQSQSFLGKETGSAIITSRKPNPSYDHKLSPGPGDYQILDKNLHRGICIGTSKRYLSFDSNNKVPGPVSYSPRYIEKEISPRWR